MSHNGRQRKALHPSQHLVGLNNGGWRTGSVDCQRTDGQRAGSAQDATCAQPFAARGIFVQHITAARAQSRA